MAGWSAASLSADAGAAYDAGAASEPGAASWALSSVLVVLPVQLCATSAALCSSCTECAERADPVLYVLILDLCWL